MRGRHSEGPSGPEESVSYMVAHLQPIPSRVSDSE